MTSGLRFVTGAINWGTKRIPRSGRTQATEQQLSGSRRNGIGRAAATTWWIQFRATRHLGKPFRMSRRMALILADWTFGPLGLFTKTFPFPCYRPLIPQDHFILKTYSSVSIICSATAG